MVLSANPTSAAASAIVHAPASDQPQLAIDLRAARSLRTLRRFQPPYFSTLGLYDRSLRSLWTRGASLGDLGGRIHVQTKQRFSALMGASITTLKTAVSWARVFQQEVGRLGYFALSGVIAAIRAVMSASGEAHVDAPPRGAPPIREPMATSPLGLKDLAKTEKAISDLFAKSIKPPAEKPAVQPKVVPKEALAQPAPVATKTVVPDRSPPKVHPAVPASHEREEKTTVSVFVTRPASLAHKPLHIHLAIQGA